MLGERSKRLFTAIFVLMLTFVGLTTPVQANIEIDTGKMPPGYVLVKKTDRKIAPGITETQLVSNTKQGDMQQIDYLMEVDMSEKSSIKVVASYGSDYDTSSWELATMAEQIEGYEAYMKKNGIKNEEVVAAVNADFFNMGTGEPMGALVMNGKIIKKPTDVYFCITKDGKADLREADEPLDDVEQAVGGKLWLVKDGKVQPMTDHVRMTREAIGLKADGSIVTFTTHGISDKSAGRSTDELAAMMAAAGCVDAIQIDGGGSATYMAKYEGTDKIEVRNNPSDGKLRAVSSGLLFISTSVKDGVFDHSSITPNEEVYTPGQTIKFEAVGVDGGGGEALIPEGITWSVDNTELATIDAKTGVATLKDKEGTLTVNQIHNGQTVGTASIEIRHPDSISFKTEEVSLGFEATSTLGLEVRWQQREVHIVDGDINWELSNPEMGHFEGNTFISSDGKTLEGIITAHSRYNQEVKGSIHAIIGKLPTVAWDFEDQVIKNEETGEETVIPAKEYWKIGKGSNVDTPFKVMPSVEDGTVDANAEIVDIDTGEVRMGKNALKLSYDFTKSPDATRGAYFGTKDDYEVPGTPTAIGVWVWAPEGIDNFWLRGQVPYMQADGTWSNGSTTYVDFTYQPNQKLPDGTIVSKEDSGINWEGWKYLEADLTQKGATKFKLQAGATFRIMYVPGIGMGTKTAGSIYLDNMQFVYGTNVEDTDSPSIDTLEYSTDNVTYNSFGDNAIINSNKISFASTFHDIQNKYSKGIAYDLVRMYVDGVNVGVKGQSESGETIFADNFIIDDSKNTSYLYDMEFANGLHSIKTVIRDKGGNETECTEHFLVQGNNAEHTSLSLEKASTSNPVLGKPYELQIKTNRLDDLDEISAKISIRKTFAQNYKIIWNEDFTEVSNTYNANKGILSISGKCKAEATNTGEGIIATIRLMMPTNIKQGTEFTYSVTNGSATYKSDKAEHYAKSFSTDKESIEVFAPLNIVADTMFLGKSGKVHVTDANGHNIEGASVYVEGIDQLLGITNAEGFIETEELSKNVAQFSIYAKKDEDISFIYTDFCFEIAGSEDGIPQHIMSHAVKDATTQKSISWFTDPFASNDKAVMQIATKTDYDESGEKAFKVVNGTTQIIKLNGSANQGDNHAFRLNSVIASGLKPGTAYVYRVGDEKQYSDMKSFTTPYNNKNVNFFVLGDIQTLDMERTNKIASTLMNSGVSYDFGLQTGDAVDNGAKFEYWDGIANLYGELLNSTNMIHVFGNHEYEGDLSGSNSKAIYNIPTDNNGDYYSLKYGNVYFAVINYTKDTAKLDNAMKWLVADAKASDATWKVVAVHQPAYFTNPTGGNDLMHKVLPPACDEAGIDFVFSGHDHTYNRTKPLIGGKVDEKGTVYMISGTTGDKMYPTVDSGFEFEKYITSFDGVYMTVSTTANTFKIEAREANGNLLDSYIRTKSFICDEKGHEYVLKDGMVSCVHCKAVTELSNFTGILKDSVSGKTMGYIGGQMQVGWKQFEDQVYFFNDKGYSEKVTIVKRDEPSCMVQERTVYHCDAASENYEVVGTRPPLHIYENHEDGSRICKICGWKQIDISQLDIKLNYDAYYYNGSPRRATMEVSYTDEKGKKTIFKQGSEFLISCSNNIYPGKATYEFIPIEVNIGDAVDRHCGSITGGRFKRTYDILLRTPKEINATDITENSVKLSWSNVDSVSGYEVHQYDEESKEYKLLKAIPVEKNNKTIEFTVDNLHSVQTYKFKVRSYLKGADGNTYYSDFTKERAVKTASIAVDRPVNLKCSDVQEAMLTLSWDKVTNATGYKVYQYNADKKKYEVVRTITNNTCTISKLKPDTAYKFKIRAYVVENAKYSYSNYTEAIEVKTKAIPTKIAAPVLDPIKASKGVLELSWNKVDNATAYNVYRYNRQTNKYENITWTKETSIELKEEPKGEINTYRVKAYYNKLGNRVLSTYSKSQSAKLLDGTTLSKINATKETLNFTWSPVKGATGYTVYRRETSEKSWKSLGATTKTAYTDKNCEIGVSYAYRILPYGKVNGVAYFGPYSTSVKGMLIGSTIEAPVLNSIKASKGVLTLSWNKIGNATGYDIYHYNRQISKYEKIAETQDLTIELKEQPKGEIDTYRVKAYFESGERIISSRYSNAQSAKLFDNTVLSPVEQIQGDATESEEVQDNLKLTWTKVNGASGYTIYRMETEKKVWERLAATSNTTYTDSTCIEGTHYAYRILPYGKVNGVAFFGPYSNSVEGMVFKKLEVVESKYNEGKIEISWTEVPGTKGYNVYRYNAETEKWNTMKSVIKGTTYIDEAVIEGESYTYMIKPYYWTLAHKVKYGASSEEITVGTE